MRDVEVSPVVISKYDWRQLQEMIAELKSRIHDLELRSWNVASARTTHSNLVYRISSGKDALEVLRDGKAIYSY